MELPSGHTATPLEGEELAEQERVWRGMSHPLVRLTPGRWLYPPAFTKFADRIYNFKFKSSDTVVMTWPKCGTTWMQEIVWTMRNNQDLAHPDAAKPINIRVPFMECDMFLTLYIVPKPAMKSDMIKEFERLCPGKDLADGMYLQVAEALPEPRTIKTHLPISLFAPSLLDTAKVVYVVRQPQDVVVSYHHHSRLFKSMSYEGTFDQFLQFFLNDDLVYGPYWQHVKEAWEMRDHPNMHFVFYEDLKADIMTELKKLNDFLGTDLTQAQLEKIQRYTSFQEMKARDNTFKSTQEEDIHMNKAVVQEEGGFYRKGEVGSWKDQLSKQQTHQLNMWVKERITSLGITFPGTDH